MSSAVDGSEIGEKSSQVFDENGSSASVERASTEVTKNGQTVLKSQQSNDDVGKESSFEKSSADKSSKFHIGLFLGTVLVFLSMMGASFTFPFLQSKRDSVGCDVVCYGSLQSTRSALSLVGATITGRLSDQLGRIPLLWLGLVSSGISYCIALHGKSITALYLAMIPTALLNQNYSVLKALFSDYQADRSATESERASAIGL